MHLDLRDYHYHLPEEKIASKPLHNRSDSKLLQYNKGVISHHIFRQIPDLLDSQVSLIFNDTKVIPSRIIFQKPTGTKIEIFLLEPAPPFNYDTILDAMGSCKWKCLVGNSKKWKDDVLEFPDYNLRATRKENIISFYWDSKYRFSDILAKVGQTPLPPYIKRPPHSDDLKRYQTIFSRKQGAVAAPTAGFHFTDTIFSDLDAKKIKKDFITLHVSSGTFQPIKSPSIIHHDMHKEQIIVSKKNIETLLEKRNIVAVGTTSLRTIESIYWFGCQLIMGEKNFFVAKNTPYQMTRHYSPKQSLEAVLAYMTKNNKPTLVGHTEIFIYPGYEFKICEGLITNFHLPQSTLILLVAAFIGANWKNVYQTALATDYRFLSYGDACLLWKS